jgi:hypothetical protein
LADAQLGFASANLADIKNRMSAPAHKKVEYIHLNPVRRGLVRHATDWKWSSVHEYAGASGEEQERRCGLRVDRVRLPADENTRI